MEVQKSSLNENKVTNAEFFKNYYNLKNTLTEDAMKRFESVKTDGERMRFFSEIASSVETLKIKWLESQKNLEKAKKLKELGNKAFSQGDDERALNLYTESLISMPCIDGITSTFAVTLANRSATLYHMTEYVLAVRDIDYALSLDYPSDLRYKIYERKARCFLALERHAEAINEFKNTLRAFDDCKLATDKKIKMQTTIQMMLDMMNKPKTNMKSKIAPQKRSRDDGKKESELKLCSARNKVYVSSCDKVDILEAPIVGRYATAAADIKEGEVLLVEKPHCSILLSEFVRLHCQHCFKKTKAPYPCKNCTTVVFCSKECQSAAEASYHKYECPVLSTVYSSGASVMVLMALRVITQKPLNYFLDMKNSLTEERKEFKQYRSSDYETLYHLVRHEELRRRDDFFERTVMAFFLLLCLKEGNYFPHTGNMQSILCSYYLKPEEFAQDSERLRETITQTVSSSSIVRDCLVRHIRVGKNSTSRWLRKVELRQYLKIYYPATLTDAIVSHRQKMQDALNESLTDEEEFIGSLILRHLQILQFNAHEIFEIELKIGNKLDQSRSVFVGGGIYPTLSLFNHSCDPGVVRYFKGSTAIIRAIKPIRKGEVIGENYGPLFTRERREDRRAKLKSQYWFNCECTACMENWPTFEEMDPNILRFRCAFQPSDDGKISSCGNVILVPQNTNEFMARCHSCGQFTNLLKGLKILQDTDAMYRQATRDADAGNIETALAIYLEILSMLDSVMAPPFRDYHLCQQAIRQCMLAMSNKID